MTQLKFLQILFVSGQEYCYRAVLSIEDDRVIDGILIHESTYTDKHGNMWTCMDKWMCVVTVQHY